MEKKNERKRNLKIFPLSLFGYNPCRYSLSLSLLVQKGKISYAHSLLARVLFRVLGSSRANLSQMKSCEIFGFLSSAFLFLASQITPLPSTRTHTHEEWMSYQHPLASLSAAAAAALPVPSRTSSPAQHQQQTTGSHQQAASHYYNHPNHAASGGGAASNQIGSSGQGGIVHSPDSIDSPRSVSETKKGRKRKASHGTGAGENKEDEKDAAAKKRQVVSCGECKVSLHCPLEHWAAFVWKSADQRFRLLTSQRRKIKVSFAFRSSAAHLLMLTKLQVDSALVHIPVSPAANEENPKRVVGIKKL